MKRDKEEWVVSLDGENYNGYMTYPTKKAAIEAGRKEFANVKKCQYSEVFDGYIGDDKFFYVGRITSPCPKVYADDIIQDLIDRAYAIYGEYAEGFLEGVDNDEKEKLECAVNNVIQSWIDKHGLNINAFLVEDVEQVKA